MSLLNQSNKKGKKGDKKKTTGAANAASKFIAKTQTGGFVNKQSNTGSQRGS